VNELFRTLKFFIPLLIISINTFSQVPDAIQRYRDDQTGDYRNEREAILDGNLIRTLFKNTGEIGHWPFQPSLEWPKGTGHSYLDGMALYLGAEVTAPGNQAVIHPIETNYREYMDKDPTNGMLWGLEPIPGYSNGSAIASNYIPSSIPQLWPAASGFPSEYNGNFPGYFGLNSRRAYETFFVADDSQDKEFTKTPYSFFPVLSDSMRGGLGLRITARTLQFTEVGLENSLFLLYYVANISDFDYAKFVAGCYIDPGVGGTSSGGDDGGYNKNLNLVYMWDHLGKGVPGDWVTGYLGFEFLETPSNSTNGIDDDNDGLIDERQDDGIDNDYDWVSFTDINHNGQWDAQSEPLNDDVGGDGVPNTNDFGEGDGIPTHGEPNFDATDKHESDEIGLTAFSFAPLADSPTCPWPKNDEAVWKAMTSGFSDTSITNTNFNVVISTGPFPFQKFNYLKIASAIVLGEDKQALLNSAIFSAHFYNANCGEFGNKKGDIVLGLSHPIKNEKLSGVTPIQYGLTNYQGEVTYFVYHYTPKDGWGLLAVDHSNNGYVNWESTLSDDGIFHKIKIFAVTQRFVLSTESGFFTVLNHAQGKPEIILPDPVGILKDSLLSGTISFPFLGGDADGDPCSISFFYQPGKNTSPLLIASGFTQADTLCNWNTKNFPNTREGILVGRIVSNADTAYFTCLDIKVDNFRLLPTSTNYITERNSLGTGDIEVHVVTLDQLTGDEYTMVFDSTYENGGSIYYNLYNKTKGNLLLAKVNEILPFMESPVFDGFRIEVKNDTSRKTVKESETGWKVGGGNANLIFSYDQSFKSWNTPADYELTFFDHIVDTSFIQQGAYTKVPVNFSITNITQNHRVKFAFADSDNSGMFSLGDEIIVLEYENSSIRLGLHIFYGTGAVHDSPAPGSILRVVQQKPFALGDTITFTTDKLVKVTNERNLMEDFSLSQNYPNPFNPSTNIRFTVPQTSFVKIKVYDFLGAEVTTLVNREMNPGNYEVALNGKTIASGVYFVRMEAGKFTETKKVILLK